MHMPQSSQPSLIIMVYPFFSIRFFGQIGMHFSHTPHSSKSITINISPHTNIFCEFALENFHSKLLNIQNYLILYNN